MGQVARLAEADVFDLLTQLSDRSLVVLEEGTAHRYRLLETVRQYARDLLAEDEQSIVFHQRHLHFYSGLAQTSAPKLKGPDQLATIALLESELENLRVALERGTSGEGSEEVLHLAADLVIFWWRQGHFLEGTEWCLRAAATNCGTQKTILRARLLNGVGLLKTFQGDCAIAKTYYQESYEILTELKDHSVLPETLCGLGFASFFLDEYAAARTHAEAALAAAKQVNDFWYIAMCGYFLGIIYRVAGDFDGAIHAYEEAIAFYRKVGDRMGASYPIYDIGLAENYRSNFGVAQKYLGESLAIRRESNDLWGVSESLFGLGLAAIGLKDYSEAREKLIESKSVARDVGDKPRIAICAHWLGQIALIEGDIDSAREFNAQCLEIYQALEDRWGLSYCLAGYASLAAKDGDTERAITLWSASDKLREDISSPLPPSERAFRDEQMAAVRKGRGEATFKRAWSEGQQIDLQKALQLTNLVLSP